MSERILRVNQLIKRELSQILVREVDFPNDILVTVTRVETTSDLKEAKVYVSVMPENRSSQALRALKMQIYEIQQRLNRRVEMKPIPKIKFVEEIKTKEAGRIEELLEKIKSQESIEKRTKK